MRFDHDTLPQRVRFGTGAAAENLAAEIDELGASRLMIIAGERDDELVRRITAELPIALRFSEVVMHVPVEVAQRARAAASSHSVDALVSVGGGSTTGLAKAIALSTGLPIIAVPTTYAGSEATNVWGLTERSEKRTGVDARVLPRTIVYDAELTMTLPVELTVASGLNALAHCVDAMWGPRADPIDRAYAGEGIRALNLGLPAVVTNPSNVDGRELALYGAYVSAVSFASAGSALHHKICHTLGGMFDLPHAQTHAVVLPHVLAFNAPNAPDARRRIASAFDADSATDGLRRLREKLGAPTALRDYGMPADGIAAAVDAIVAAAPASNPTPVTVDGISALLHAAWSGK
ncbi:MAG: maleylacetate reductase [Sciscionella sp.]|nr:maleylacetate reductase [Sciscionella sp.]